MKISSFIITASLAFGSTSFAQTVGVECVTEMNLYKSQIDGGGGGIASYGDLVAHTEGSGFNIKLYDATDRNNPNLLSTIPGLGFNDSYGARVALGQDRLVASNPYKDLVLIVDTTNPASPVIGATLHLDPRQILIQGHTLFIRKTSTVEIYDISDVMNPVLVNSLLGTNTYGVLAIAGNLIAVADTSAGLRILDSSDPANISELSLFPIANNGRLAVQDSLVAISASSPSTTQFIDISDPSNPFEISSTGIPYTTQGFSFLDNYLLYPTTSGVRIYDISSIASPQYAGVIAGPEVLNSQSVTSLGDELAMISGSYFSIIDIQSVPGMNSLISAGTPVGTQTNPDLRGMFVEGDYAFTYDTDNSELLVLDVSDSTNPSVATTFPIVSGSWNDSNASPIEYADGVVYIGSTNDSIIAIDVTNPLIPALINSWVNPQGPALALDRSGDYLYVMPYVDSPITVFDVSSLMTPTLVATISVPSFNYNTTMTVSGDRLAYIQYYEGGGSSLNYLHVLDIADPINPVELNFAPESHFLNYFAGGIQIVGDNLYLTSGGYYHAGPSVYVGSFASYNITDDIELLDQISFQSIEPDFDDGGKLGKIMIDGDLAYVTSRYLGGSTSNQSISLFDISNPASLKYKGASGTETRLPSRWATKQGDKIYMAGGYTTEHSMAIFDASSCVASCPADLNGDGYLDFFDISAFLAAFSSQDPIADFTNDSIWDFFDVSAFLSAFNAGCP